MQHNTLRLALAKMQSRGHVDAVDPVGARGALREGALTSHDPAQLIRRFA
jgi:hypothetical protein